MRKSLLAACLLTFAALASATTSFTLYGTGFTNAGALVSAGGTDGNWTLESDPAVNDPNGGCNTTCAGQVTTPAAPFVTNGAPGTWLADTSSSQWISPRSAETGDSDPYSTATPYVYRESFTIPVTLNPTTAIIVGQWSVDNYGNIVVNGTPVTLGASGAIASGTTGAFGFTTAFTLNSSNATFHTGVNTLAFAVFNNATGSPDVTGVNIQITSSTANAVPEPSSFALMALGLVSLAILALRSLRLCEKCVTSAADKAR